jgi:hypothetical protein
VRDQACRSACDPRGTQGRDLEFSLVDSDRLDGRVCATTVTTVDYLATRALGGRQAKKLVRQVLDLFGVTAVDGRVLEAALRLDFADFEDAVVHEAARACGAAAS